MASDEVMRFNKLKRTKMARNVWHFDVRYIHLEPIPGHILFLFQPESNYVHFEHLPIARDNKLSDTYQYFPETAEEAAPEIVRAIVHLFLTDFGRKGIEMQQKQKQDLQAPWKLTGEEKHLALAVGKEFARVGVNPSLCAVEQSSEDVLEDALVSFLDVYSRLAGARPTTLLQFPNSISFDYDPYQNLPKELKVVNRKEEVPSQKAEYMDRVLQYIQFVETCSPTTPEKADNPTYRMSETIIATEAMLRRPFAELLKDAEAGNVALYVDCASRSYLGFGSPRDRQTARNYLIKAAFHPESSDATRATAHALLTRWYHDIAGPGQEIRMRYMYASLHHASLALKFARSIAPPGFSIPQITSAFGDIKELITKDNPLVKRQYPVVFAALKETKERCERELQASLTRMKQPLRYRCAAVGCGIEADHGRMLKRCSGPCDEDKKPHYCSKECQKNDWPNHKGFCKPGAPCSVVDTDKALNSAPLSKKGQRSILINTPGGQMNFASSTISPQVMREVKELMEKREIKDEAELATYRRAMKKMRNFELEIVKTVFK
ncbi:MYND-type domain-containing protein [Mycena chlorophos]|uniref:MYND-type domain-containing protein n=1 Tax=Mycena chlorophos TaxID=658473 RepID=A0A8H6W4Y6_MYCCL|nr:MYND-type domain-containing protein [Mycena chlorophos]